MESTYSHDTADPQHHEQHDVDPESQQQTSLGPDEGSDDDDDEDIDGDSDVESYDALEDRFHGLEEEVATLVADVHDLALYTKLNITGFMKILKVSAKLVMFASRLRRLPETRCDYIL